MIIEKLLFLYSFTVVEAQPGFTDPNPEKPPAGGLPTEDSEGNPINLPTEGSLFSYVVDILNLILGLLGIVLVIFLLYGGFKYMFAGGSENEVENAQNIITNAIIGIILVGLVWSFANFVLTVAFGPAIGG